MNSATISDPAIDYSPIIKIAQSLRVAFQGERGAFSEEAARALLGEAIELVPRASFESLFCAIDEGVADVALAPLENSLAGSVHKSYDLLLTSNLIIASEIVIRIEHYLIGCPGADLASIRVVESHPVALAQCERFFTAHPEIKREASDDTAASVRRIVERGDPTRAAIAGKNAALLYGGSILREHIEDHHENYTRFGLLAPASPKARQAIELAAHLPPRAADKLSLAFRLASCPGALHSALEPFARRGLDLLKIESRPIIGQPWQYRFYLDLRASNGEEEVACALSELRARAEEVRVLGCYASALNLEKV